MHHSLPSLFISAGLLVAAAVGITASTAQAQLVPGPPMPSTVGEWSALPDYPFPVSNNAVTSVSHGGGAWTVYSFMGFRELSQMPFSAVVTPLSFRLDLPGGSWTPIASPPLLQGKARIAANAVTVRGEVYLLGGYTAPGIEVTDPRLFKYEPATDTYLSLGVVPREVDDTAVGVYQNRYIYLMSGWHGPISRNIRAVQIYDVQLGQWLVGSPLTDVGVGVFGQSGAIVGDQIICIGGANGGFQFSIHRRVHIGTIDPLGTGDVARIDWTTRPAHPGSPIYRGAGSLGAGLRYFLVTGGSETTYNLHGLGYNTVTAEALDQTLLLDAASGRWSIVRTRGTHQPTMDHRALVRVGRDRWATVGGLVQRNVRTAAVYQLDLQIPSDATR